MRGMSLFSKPTKPIRVFLVPSQTYEVFAHESDLRVLRDRLNEAQQCFRFQIVYGGGHKDILKKRAIQRRVGASIKKTRSLLCSDSRAYAPRKPAEK